MRKSLFFGLVAILGLVGCSRNQEIDVPDANLSLFARTESPAESRTIVESGVHVYWEPGDEIAVFMGEKSAKFTTDITAASGTATFKGTFGDTTWPEEPDLWAVYPFSEDAAFDGETITTVIPSTQIAREESFAKGANVSIAHSTSANLQFFNVCGGVRFSVEEEGITSIRFESLNHEPIAGKVKISFIDGLPSLKSIEKEDDCIVLNAPDGASFVPGKHYYFTALPVSLSGGYTITIIKDNQSASKVSRVSTTIKRAIFGTLRSVDKNLEYHDLVNDGDISTITSIVDECIQEGRGSVYSLFSQRIDEVRSIPAVDEVISDENGALVFLKNGSVIECPFYADSPFDQRLSTSEISQDSKRLIPRSVIQNDWGVTAENATVVVFNLFSNDTGRTVQNKLVDITVNTFIQEYGSKNVFYGGFEDFTSTNLRAAMNSDNCKILFIYSLGSGSALNSEWSDKLTDWISGEDSSAHYGDRLAIGGAEWDGDPVSYVFYSGDHQYRSIGLDSFFHTFPANDKIVYFGSCYTLRNSVFDQEEWKAHTYLYGWTGLNCLGQAYGLVMSEYLSLYNKTLVAFWDDFKDDEGRIVESTHFGNSIEPELVRKGKIAIRNIQDDDDGYKTYDHPLHFRHPSNGKCLNNLYNNILDKNYSIDVKVVANDNITWDDIKDYYTNAGVFAFSYGFKWENIDPSNWDQSYRLWRTLSFFYLNGLKAKKITFDNLQSGVLKLAVTRSFGPSSNSQSHHLDDINNEPDDVVYVFITRDFGDNDAQFVDPDDVITEPETIDLGLPSGTKWASFNLGASKPEEYGGYFAWGETTPKVDYSWESYGWCNGNESSLTKYYYGDGKSALESTDDAAIQLLGGKWRMPSESEWKELIDYCSWTSSSSNGVDGMIAKSKINGAELFFPFSGKIDGTETMNFGSVGYYWTSSLYPFESLACIGATSPETGFLERYCGLAIRPVYGENITIPDELGDAIIEVPDYLDFECCPVGQSKSLSIDVKNNGDGTLIITDISIRDEDLSASYNWTSASIAPGASKGLIVTITPLKTGPHNAYLDIYSNASNQDCPGYNSYLLGLFGQHVSPVYSAEMVDLGLTVKWASCDLGANSQYDFGELFAWGETERKNNYSWENYKWCDGTEFSINKYTYDDGPRYLESSDDAATAHLGKGWRIPTEKECQDLIDKCTWRAIEKNGIPVFEATSQINGKKIYFMRKKNSVGQLSDYWTNEIWGDESATAFSLCWYGNGEECNLYFSGSGKAYGALVRPVYDDK